MNIFYRIIAEDTKIYTRSLSVCDQMRAALIANGYTPNVTRLRYSQVPISDIRLVINLK